MSQHTAVDHRTSRPVEPTTIGPDLSGLCGTAGSATALRRPSNDLRRWLRPDWGAVLPVGLITTVAVAALVWFLRSGPSGPNVPGEVGPTDLPADGPRTHDQFRRP